MCLVAVLLACADALAVREPVHETPFGLEKPVVEVRGRVQLDVLMNRTRIVVTVLPV